MIKLKTKNNGVQHRIKAIRAEFSKRKIPYIYETVS